MTDAFVSDPPGSITDMTEQHACLVCRAPMTITAPRLTHEACAPTLGDELLSGIRYGISTQPRNHQDRIGPSEIGMECSRRVGYLVSGQPRTLTNDVAWKPFIGTAVHAMLAQIWEAFQRTLDTIAPQFGTRFYVEEKTTSGQVVGPDTIDGTSDLFDAHTNTVIDWKVTGDYMLRRYRRLGPGWQYRTQGSEYGRGWTARGFDVRRVMIVFLPMAGEFHDTYLWDEPFSPDLAERAYARIDQMLPFVTSTNDETRRSALEGLRTADTFCTKCPFYRKVSTDVLDGCPGHSDPATYQPPSTTPHLLFGNRAEEASVPMARDTLTPTHP